MTLKLVVDLFVREMGPIANHVFTHAQGWLRGIQDAPVTLEVEASGRSVLGKFGGTCADG
jgi:hypothetical protein